jgi:hypothetical protein
MELKSPIRRIKALDKKIGSLFGGITPELKLRKIETYQVEYNLKKFIQGKIL